MKMTNRIILAALFAAALSLSVAQAQPGPPRPGAPMANEGDEMPPPRIQRFLDKLQEDDPQEYERLLELRENDPEAYRQALRERMRDAREQRGGMRDAREQRGMRDGGGAPGPRDEDRLDGPPDRDRRRHHEQSRGMRGGDWKAPNPEMEKVDASVREITKKLRNAPPEEQEELRGELKAALEKGFDLRQQMRKDRLTEMEKRVEHIKNILDKRASQRDEIIQRRLDEITGQGARPE